MRVAVEPYDLPLREPLETARGPIERREGWLLRVGTDPTGLGAATPLPPFTEDLETCRTHVAAATDALRTGEVDAALAECAGAPAARHAVALALADREARNAGVPLARHLDAAAAPAVAVNATVGDADAASTAERVAAAAGAGFDCVKVKVGARSVAADAERLEAARAAVGDDVTLRADANGAWEVASAERALAAFAEHDVSYVEQPLPAPALDEHAGLRGGTVGVALDESVAATSPRAVLDAGAADVLVCKPMALGGPDRVRTAVADARAAGVTPVVTTTVDGLVARLGALHVAASAGDLPPCGLATAGALATDLGPDPAPVAAGTLTVPDTPGLGVAPTEVSAP